MNVRPSPLPRKRGRPAGQRTGQRARLLLAARELLEDPAKLPTLKQVAGRAGVTPALAHYYFASRDGLLDALLTERVAPRIEDLTEAARLRAEQPVAALTFLMQRTISLLLTDRLLQRCLWLQVPQARALRDQLRSALRELLDAAQRSGQLRRDLSVDHLTESLLGLVLFPFLDMPADNQGGAERAAELTLQNVALLQDGIVRNQRPRQDSAS